MYPSLIQSERLCWSTFCTDDKYAHVPGVNYLDVPIDGQVYRFAQDAAAPSIMPEMLRDLVS